jgi:DNA invertase Pin-like site-specific DNA recombinase
MSSYRVYGYIRPSPVPQIAGPEEQSETIKNYCRRAGLGEPQFYVDPADGGRLALHRRVAGGRLTQDLQRGDHLIAARLDRLADSFFEAVLTLDAWYRRGVTVHLLDVPGGRLDAGSPHTVRLIEALNSFAWAGRRMIGIRVRESFAHLKKEGRRCSRHAPYGFRWERRGGKTFHVEVPEEQVILRRLGELYLQGYSFDQLRQYVNCTWGVRNRNGREFGYTETRNMVARGAELLVAEASDRGTTQPHPIPQGGS